MVKELHGQYSFNWQTAKSQANKCYLLLLKLNDGSTYTASFSLK